MALLGITWFTCLARGLWVWGGLNIHDSHRQLKTLQLDSIQGAGTIELVGRGVLALPLWCQSRGKPDASFGGLLWVQECFGGLVQV